METFKIELDQYTYRPGEQLSGKVLISTSHSISERFLKIRAEGKAHTEWVVLEGKDKTKQEKKSMVGNFTYLSSECMFLIPGENLLPPGKHKYDFSFKLPDNCPPSFEGTYGNLRYTVHAELGPNYHVEKRVSVLPTVCPHNITAALSPIVSFVSQNTGWLAQNGLVFMTVHLPKQLFSPREVIPILVSIENDSKKQAVSVISRMYRNHTYKTSKSRKTDVDIIATSHRQVSIAPKEKGQIELTLKVPNTVCTFQSELMSVDYMMKVELSTMSLFGGTISCAFVITVSNASSLEPRVEVVETFPPLSSEPPEYESLQDDLGLPPSYEEAVQRK